MKNNLYLLLVPFILLSCKSNTKLTNKDSVTIDTKDTVQANLIKKFGPFIDGAWVKKDYLDEIAKTKSPLESFEKAWGITTILIDSENIKADSCVIAVGLENHEGGEVVLKSQKGQTPASLKTTWATVDDKPGDFYELGYVIQSHDTLLTFNRYNKRRKLIASSTYIKTLNSIRDQAFGDGTYHAVNKILTAGTYSFKDTTGISSTAQFDINGNVHGFLNFKTYFINIDFAEGPRQNLDEITFDLSKNNMASYSFKIASDTLKLYEYTQNKDSTEMILGKLKYKLVRKK